MNTMDKFRLFCEGKARREACKPSLAPEQKNFSVTHPHTRMVYQIPDDGSEISKLFREGEKRRVEAEASKPYSIYLVYGSQEWYQSLDAQVRRMANSHATY